MTTSVNPIFIYELLKQKIDWNTKLTPVARISDFVETFNTENNLNVVIGGKNLTKSLIQDCKDKIQASDKLSTLNLDSSVKTVVVNILDVCLLKNGNGSQLQTKMDLIGFDKPINELISGNENEESLFTSTKGIKKQTKYAVVDIGKNQLSPEKREVLGLVLKLLNDEYQKIDKKLQDGELKQQILNEVGMTISSGQKYVDLIDTSLLVNDQKLCDATDSFMNTSMTITNINKFRMLDSGNSFCIDLDVNTFFIQQRVQSITGVPPSPSKMAIPSNESGDRNGKEMMKTGKAPVLESYVAGLLNEVYKDKTKYSVEVMRPNENVILLKIKDNSSKEIIFNKIDITNAVSDGGLCQEEKMDSRIREYVVLQKFCKRGNVVKIQYVSSGSDNTKITNKKIPFAKLEEAKNQKVFQSFLNENYKISNKSAFVVYSSDYASPFGLFGSGIYGAGLYGYPRFGLPYGGIYNTGLYGTGLYGTGLYGGGLYSSPYVYMPPLVTSIVPTAPVVAPVASSPIVSAPILSSNIPYTYSYPMITTSNYTVGSYYSPYTYSSPFQYSYSTPFVFVKSSEKHLMYDENSPDQTVIRVRKQYDNDIPQIASSLGELRKVFSNSKHDFSIEKIDANTIRLDINKKLIKETHYYTIEDGILYHTSGKPDFMLNL